MKLKNKKTGEIIEHALLSSYGISGDVAIEFMDENAENGYSEYARYHSLAGLNEEWEDAPEEPKQYWYIGNGGKVYGFDEYFVNSQVEDDYREIGNLFETKEEAEKAVEKLKAWKRLKDEYDFKFTGWKRDDQYRGDFIISAQDWNTSDDKLLDLLFGGEI